METKYLSSAGTFSKNPEMFGMGKDWFVAGVDPADGTRIYTTQSPMIDWVSSLGANLYGHNHLGVINAIESQLHNGLNFSIVHELEYEVAELLATKVGSRIPGWDSDNLQVRFMKTGTDACNAAVRLARAETGKGAILSCGYHGWGSAFTAGTPPAHGIPIEYQRNLIQHFKYGDKVSLAVALQAVRGNLAAIIIEHPPDTSINEKEWYAYLRKVCDVHNALLIVDEVVTGLRFGIGGVCELYGIQPDLVCYGKALGGGLALSALTGPKEYMKWFSRNDPVFVSSTQFGETLPLAAAKEVLVSWDQKKVDYIWECGKSLMDRVGKYVGIYGHPPRSLFKFKDEVKRAFFIHGMIKRGILVNRPNFPALSHTDDHVRETVNAIADVVTESHEYSYDQMKKMMEDKMPRILFRNR